MRFKMTVMATPFRFLSILLCCCSIGVSHVRADSLVFSTHWLPQAQFAGYYMAQEKGFYEEAGIELELIHPPANVNALRYLSEGKADIVSLFLVTALDARIKGLPLVQIAQMSEHSAILFVGKKERGVKEINDFEGKKIGVWKSGFAEVPKAMVQARGITVDWVPVLSSVNLFLMDGIDLMTVMWYNEYNAIYLSGVNEEELCTFFLSDYGYDIPEDGLYVTEATLEGKKEALTAFTAASLKGWQYAAAHPEEAIAIVLDRMRQAKVPASEAHQAWMLEKIIELQGFRERAHKDISLPAEVYENTLQILLPTQEASSGPAFDDFVKTLSLPSK
jgi:NitT/TauT family transport system substrate-binding protein